MWFNEFIYKQHGGGRLSNFNKIITIKKSKKQKATITETLFGIKKKHSRPDYVIYYRYKIEY